MSRAPHLHAVKSMDMSTTIHAPTAWKPLLDGFDAELRAAGRRPGTREMRHYQLRRFASENRDTPLHEFTREKLIAWLGSRDWSAETLRAYRAALVTFFRWAHAAGHVPDNPAADLPKVNPPRALPRPAPDHILIAGLRDADPRASTAIEIIDATGIRRTECAALRSEHVITTFDGPAIRVVGKGGHERIIPIPDRVAAKIRAADGWVFPSPMKQAAHLTPAHLGKLISHALPEDWTAHTLRHRYATRVYRACRDIRAVQELLGHARIETTMRYVGISDDRLRTAASTTWDIPWGAGMAA